MFTNNSVKRIAEKTWWSRTNIQLHPKALKRSLNCHKSTVTLWTDVITNHKIPLALIYNGHKSITYWNRYILVLRCSRGAFVQQNSKRHAIKRFIPCGGWISILLIESLISFCLILLSRHIFPVKRWILRPYIIYG